MGATIGTTVAPIRAEWLSNQPLRVDMVRPQVRAGCKTLSQWEIDALLNTSAAKTPLPAQAVVSRTRRPSDRTIKLYDFRRPDRFSKEHIRAIQNIHETFARVTASSLSSYLRSTTTVSLSSIEQVVYDEYVHQLANPTLVNLVELQPLAGRIVVEMNMNLGLAMLDRMMGGPGPGQHPPQRADRHRDGAAAQPRRHGQRRARKTAGPPLPICSRCWWKQCSTPTWFRRPCLATSPRCCCSRFTRWA